MYYIISHDIYIVDSHTGRQELRSVNLSKKKLSEFGEISRKESA